MSSSARDIVSTTMRALACRRRIARIASTRSEEHTSELQSLRHLVCRLLLEKKKLHVPTKDSSLSKFRIAHDITGARQVDMLERVRERAYAHDGRCRRHLRESSRHHKALCK